MSVYSLARRSGVLQTSIGRRLFKSAYFLYKRYIEDDLRDLLLAFPSIIGTGDILDVGANIGYTAVLLASVAEPGRTVHAFEPEPFNFGILEQTALEHEAGGKILPLHFAVGAENATISLWINDRHPADHRVATEHFRSEHSGLKEVNVAQVSIDNFLKDRQRQVSFVKIDVQGYELAVCQGMQNTVLENPDIAIVLEFMPSIMREMGFEPSELIDYFVERGFKIYQVHPRGRLTQGVPVAAKDSSYFDLLFCRRDIMCDREA